MRSLEGKRIIVTGAASGMGAESVVAFVRAGASVVGWYRNVGPESVLARLNDGERRSILFARHDVADKTDVEAGIAEAVKHLGGLDVLVNAAGIAPSVDSRQASVEDWEETMGINARGTMLTNTLAHPHLAARGGKIINFASSAGVNGLPGKAYYSASKGAVLAWTRCIAKEWARDGITVNAIAPAIWTPMYDKMRAELSAAELAQHDAFLKIAIPLGGKLGDPEKDFAPMMVFLAGDGANFLTGQTYCIDGGNLMLS